MTDKEARRAQWYVLIFMTYYALALVQVGLPLMFLVDKMRVADEQRQQVDFIRNCPAPLRPNDCWKIVKGE